MASLALSRAARLGWITPRAAALSTAFWSWGSDVWASPVFPDSTSFWTLRRQNLTALRRASLRWRRVRLLRSSRLAERLMGMADLLLSCECQPGC